MNLTRLTMQRREEMVEDIDDYLNTLIDGVEHEREQCREN
jgi:hypothetical protein